MGSRDGLVNHEKQQLFERILALQNSSVQPIFNLVQRLDLLVRLEQGLERTREERDLLAQRNCDLEKQNHQLQREYRELAACWAQLRTLFDSAQVRDAAARATAQGTMTGNGFGGRDEQHEQFETTHSPTDSHGNTEEFGGEEDLMEDVQNSSEYPSEHSSDDSSEHSSDDSSEYSSEHTSRQQHLVLAVTDQEARTILCTWYDSHGTHSMPTAGERKLLSQQTGWPPAKVRQWFCSAISAEKGLSAEQRAALEEAYCQNHSPIRADRAVLSKRIQRRNDKVEGWFQLTRDRKKQVRQGLFTDEQTLPLRRWRAAHPGLCKPTRLQRQRLAEESGLTLVQVTNYVYRRKVTPYSVK